MAITSAALIAELSNNPTSRRYDRSGYADADSYYLGVLSELNRPDDTFRVSVMTAGVPRDIFMRLIAASAFRIPVLAEPKKSGWTNMLAMIRAADSINVPATDIQGLLALGVADGVITADEKAAIDAAADAGASRPGSRAEQLFGAGTVVTLDDLAKAGA